MATLIAFPYIKVTFSSKDLGASPLAYGVPKSLSMLDEIATAGQVAASLEVCGSPKPGNVHRNADFPGTTFEQFITGSIALGPALHLATQRGWDVGCGKRALGGVMLGGLMAHGVRSVSQWQKGGNTHLGIIMLFIPLAAAAGLQAAKGERDVSRVRCAVTELLDASTVADSVALYATLRRLSSTWLGRLSLSHKPPDVRDPNAAVKLKRGGWTLYKVMKASSRWDAIASELSSSMKITFDIGLPTFKTTYRKTSNLNVAIVHTFLTILSLQSDTFIARKVRALKEKDATAVVSKSIPKVETVSERAKVVLGLGGLLTKKGRVKLLQMDAELRSFKGTLNPGSTADLTASTLYVALLSGFRP